MNRTDVVVPIAPGFEETEAVAILDVLRRAGLSVVAAGLTEGVTTGSHGIAIRTDRLIDELVDADVRAVVLPGGMPGAEHLRTDPRVQRLLRNAARRGAVTAAVCAAPMALAQAGLLEGRKATAYPGFEGRLGGATRSEARVVVDGTVITGRGPGAAVEFALAVAAALTDPATAERIGAEMLVLR